MDRDAVEEEGRDVTGSRRPRCVVALACLLLSSLALAACSGTDEQADAEGALGERTAPAPARPTDDIAEVPAELREAVSHPRTDSVYPEHGNEVVDALHYDLDLTWHPGRRHLTGVQTLVLRAATDAPAIPLELGDSLDVDAVAVDGTDVGFRHRGTDLTLAAPVTAGDVHTVRIDYAGTPQPTPAPNDLSSFAQGVGWITDTDGSTWTLQEPYGAFTWYAVNDHPSDKALYDFTLTSTGGLTGVANGENTDHLAQGPAGGRAGTWPSRRRRTWSPSPSTTSRSPARPGRPGCRSRSGRRRRGPRCPARRG
ncbi:gluzincin family metallopeptidase [Nocardioides sambongensis]|uniref:hypothetical protein n=1 Tax=Nocardioides sambongensis TaxID=2589074 RepID=UPI0015E83B7C|nr:hypothetical protein [Nocardioides sambongensis]